MSRWGGLLAEAAGVSARQWRAAVRRRTTNIVVPSQAQCAICNYSKQLACGYSVSITGCNYSSWLVLAVAGEETRCHGDRRLRRGGRQSFHAPRLVYEDAALVERMNDMWGPPVGGTILPSRGSTNRSALNIARATRAQPQGRSHKEPSPPSSSRRRRRRRRRGMDGGGAALPDAGTAICGPTVAVAPAGIRVENCYVFKSRLQEYAQKAGLPTPEYLTLKEGPSHEPIFRSTVVVNNTKYESLPGFFSRKAAEQSAAEVALMEIAKSMPISETKNIPAVQETGLCKNLLQEYAQKMNYAIPSYICTKHASGVAPFVCTVEIGGIIYIGAAARTKKDAEIKAARTALLAIQGQSEGCANGATKYIVVPGQRQVKEAEKKPAETPKPLQVKKSGYKKKRNKRKFIRKSDYIVDAEKDGAREAGDFQDSDLPVQAIITEEPARDTITLHPGEEDRSHMELLIKTTEQNRILVRELLRDKEIPQPDKEQGRAMLLHYEETRRVECELSSDSATVQSSKEVVMLQPDEESRTVALQSNGDATYVEKPPSNTAMTKREESESTMQEVPCNGEPV